MAVAGTITERIIKLREMLTEDPQIRVETKKQVKRSEDKMAKSKKAIEKKAKDIMAARKQRKAENEKRKPAFEGGYAKTPSRSRDKPLPNKPLNLHEKIAVRLDPRTVVYVNPGYDIEKLKFKYLG